MCSLSVFPSELLLLVYRFLGDIDDVFHLARCCRWLNALLESDRIGILKSVILGSGVYKYDIRLSRFIAASQTYCANYVARSSPPGDCRPDASLFIQCSEATEDDLTSDQVWDIVCRWQGLRLLQDLYLHPSIQPLYLKSIFPYEQWDHRTGLADRLASEGPISMPNSSTAPISETSLEPQTHYRFNSQQTQRFYQALTAHWLSIECLRLVEICNYRTQTLNIQHYETLHNMWANNDERTLRESCDVLEVYDFVQGYLVRKIFADVTEISQWVHGEEQGIVIDERPEDNWDYFVKTARLHLRPFDIIELFLMGPWRTNMNSLSYPPDKVAYFRHRGLFDTGGLIDIQDTGNSPDPWFSVFHLETDVGLKLMATDKGLTNVWAYFRNKWVMQGIRKELWLAESDEDIAGWIRKFGEGRNYSSTNKTSPHISGKSLCREYVSPNALGPSN